MTKNNVLPQIYDNAGLCIHDLVETRKNDSPDSCAILAPGRIPISYSDLYKQVVYTVGKLRRCGVNRNDRVAVVLPNGPEMAVTFLSVASGATCAPLNPGYKAQEFEFFLSDLNAKALVVQSGVVSAALDVAKEHAIQIIELEPRGKDSAGTFRLLAQEVTVSKTLDLAQSTDIALVLHTSGTTSRPKIVPLTHTNLCINAGNISRTLKLTPKDRCLNVMPLFHIHGLIGVLLSSIYSGASIICSPGFVAPNFFPWIVEFQPTWYSAVPTMHQSILMQSKRYGDVVKRYPLSFVRSSSSALPPQVMQELEDTFGAPVIEAYGMTEGSHQISCNPLPPGKRKEGTVGLPTGPEVSIMNDAGELLEQGEIGEIVLRGITITAGYENNPKANSENFTQGWFRTGDQGYFDEDNYLVIIDRIKEIINRGGEKISPREVDEVLLDYPGVVQAVTFGMPHSRLGEEVAAAVVLREGVQASEWDIQEYVSERLADFKVPRKVLILNEIPKGPTGKIQRIGLAERLGLQEDKNEVMKRSGEYVPPRSDTEKILGDVWSDVLDLDKLSVFDNFFQLGGDSILAGRIIARLGEELNIPQLPLVIFLHAPTIEKMASYIEEKKYDLPPASLVAVQQEGQKTPIYCVHACEGEVLFLSSLARNLGYERPFYALRAQGLDGKNSAHTSIEDMASHYVKEILAVQPEGSYIFCGAGVGGLIAYDMAQRLVDDDKKVDLLILMDTLPPKSLGFDPRYSGFFSDLGYMLRRITFYLSHGDFFKEVRMLLNAQYRQLASNFVPRFKIWKNVQNAAKKYELKMTSVNMVLLVPEKRLGFSNDPKERIDGWHGYSAGTFDSKVVPGEHLDIFREPYVVALADSLKEYLEEID